MAKSIQKKSKLKNIEQHQPVATSTVQKPDETIQETQEPVGDPIIIDEPLANVGITVNYTKNLGNYESMKFGVSLHMPTKTAPDALDESFEFIKDWLDTKMKSLLEGMD